MQLPTGRENMDRINEHYSRVLVDKRRAQHAEMPLNITDVSDFWVKSSSNKDESYMRMKILDDLAPFARSNSEMTMTRENKKMFE